MIAPSSTEAEIALAVALVVVIALWRAVGPPAPVAPSDRLIVRGGGLLLLLLYGLCYLGA